jgi:acyl-CoA thioesterase FadM
MQKRYAHPEVDAIRELPLLLTQVIPAKWQDQNGHVNVSFYMDIYNASGWPLLDLIGVDQSYFSERKLGLVDLDNHIRYISELHVGDRVSIYGQFFSCDAKRVHGAIFVVNDGKDLLASTIEFLSISIDLEKRRSTEIPEDIAERLKKRIREQRQLDWAASPCMSLAR